MSKAKEVTNVIDHKKVKKGKKGWIIGLTGFLVIVAAVVVLVVIQKQQQELGNTSGLTNGSKAPNFSEQSTKGQVSLIDYKGKTVVLYFYEGNG